MKKQSSDPIKVYEEKLRKKSAKRVERMQRDFDKLDKKGIEIKYDDSIEIPELIIDPLVSIENMVKMKRLFPEATPEELPVNEFRKRIDIIKKAEEHPILVEKLKDSEKYKKRFDEMSGRSLSKDTETMYNNILVKQKELKSQHGDNSQNASLTNAVRIYGRENSKRWNEKKIKSTTESMRKLIGNGTLILPK